MEIYFFYNFYYFFCKYKSDGNMYQAFKLHKDSSEFGTGITVSISNYDGYVYYERIKIF